MQNADPADKGKFLGLAAHGVDDPHYHQHKNENARSGADERDGKGEDRVAGDGVQNPPEDADDDISDKEHDPLIDVEARILGLGPREKRDQEEDPEIR